ncbi:WYL domain-containing protein [Parapedobacter defluvii]|uniref:WYL domain-containing protein n=1 Tax=Parapedobacter defluvii TaxID=2045106 RepID=A0ABQ1MSR9_9SPHI|nr:WYL domain-containing protein [Parapedobacter defluvii]RQP15794.1 MAG: WYL domain-containing protein [Parapedobacter sp.]GGC46113.1 WYL domain-containing protein [Parapedobacter defluvii]
MSLRETLIRHQLVINKLRVRPYTWKEIDQFLRQESEIQQYRLYVGQRQFQRDKDDIFSLYGIEIENNRSTKKYWIGTSEETDARHLEAFDVFNLLKVGGNKTGEVSFERRRPQGTENMYGLLHAIQNKLTITFQYHKFYESSGETRKVEPYALKEAKHRWYLLCRDIDKQELRLFGLDRISGIEFTKKKFTKSNEINIENIFRSSFGIILPEEGQQVEEVELSFTPFQGKYIKSLPLHESQEIIHDNEQELRVKLRIYITHDFIMELLSYGKEVKVLHPATLADDLKQQHYQAARQY